MRLEKAIGIVADELRTVHSEAGDYASDPRGYHAKLRVALNDAAERLQKSVGAVIVQRWDGASIRVCGVRSTSTSGLSGAMSNWLAAARRKASETR